MARLNVVIALFSALLLVAFACAWEPSRGGSCEKQLDRINLRSCEKHIREQIEDEDEEEDSFLTMKGVKYVLHRSRSYEDDDEKKCCEQLNELNSPECQCKALKRIMENQSEKLQRSEKREMQQELMKLPNTCGFGPLFGCRLNPDD